MQKSINRRTFEIADKAFRIGNHISDNQLKMLLDYYRNLTEHLSFVGDLYHLVWKDANNQYHRLLDMSNARKTK